MSHLELNWQERTGRRFRIVHCRGALDSFRKAAKHAIKGKVPALERTINIQVERLIDGIRLSTENFKSEGYLPSGKHFYALKKIPIRGYCWYSQRHPNTIFISHYIYKDFDKLDEKDTNRVSENWRRIEECGDEF